MHRIVFLCLSLDLNVPQDRLILDHFGEKFEVSLEDFWMLLDLLRAAHHVVFVLLLYQGFGRSHKGHFLPYLHLVHEAFTEERLADFEAELEVPPVT